MSFWHFAVTVGYAFLCMSLAIGAVVWIGEETRTRRRIRRASWDLDNARPGFVHKREGER